RINGSPRVIGRRLLAARARQCAVKRSSVWSMDQRAEKGGRNGASPLDRLVRQDILMPLQGEAKKLYQREYMRRQRAGLPTRAPPKPKGQCCSLCGRSPSRERIVIASGRGVRICETCVAEVAVLIAETKAAEGSFSRAKN